MRLSRASASARSDGAEASDEAVSSQPDEPRENPTSELAEHRSLPVRPFGEGDEEDIGAMQNLLVAYRQIITEMDLLLVEASGVAQRLALVDNSSHLDSNGQPLEFQQGNELAHESDSVQQQDVPPLEHAASGTQTSLPVDSQLNARLSLSQNSTPRSGGLLVSTSMSMPLPNVAVTPDQLIAFSTEQGNHEQGRSYEETIRQAQHISDNDVRLPGSGHRQTELIQTPRRRERDQRSWHSSMESNRNLGPRNGLRSADRSGGGHTTGRRRGEAFMCAARSLFTPNRTI